ncbi:MAG: hypothetical protein KDC71_22900, partial [Acidobacteria bacterium]|nr:hypothetical protein [Acidobacteriota bacterium]
MAIITIKGRIGYIQEAKGGLIISVAENKTNNLAKTKWHRVAIWGPKAKQIAKVIYKGAEFEFRCDWDTVTKNGKNYTNITVNTWKHIPKVEKVKVERSE